MRGTVGLVTVDSSDLVSEGDTCAGAGGYSDLTEGADIVIRDSDGKKIAIGELGAGSIPDEGAGCDFKFKVDDVPDAGGIYSIEVSHRGEVSFKKADADGLVLTVGG